MDTSASGTLAVELYPHSPTHWVATYYPMVTTPAGRWADVTWVLHQCLMPLARYPLTSTRWLELGSSDPAHPGYDRHPLWSAALAAGYATARVVHTTETANTTGATLSPEETRQLRAATTVVPAAQLTEWLLDDLQHLDC